MIKIALFALAALLAEAAEGPGRTRAAETAAPNWQPYRPALLREAREADRPALVKVGTDWCEVCRRMDETTFRDERVLAALAGLTIVSVDGDAEPDYLRRHGIEGFPTLLLFDEAGREVARRQGYVAGDALIELLAAVGAAPACSIEGHVLDPRGEPLVGELTVAPNGPTRRTARDGSYCIAGLSPGPHQMMVVADSQGALRVAFDVPADGRTVHRDVVLVKNPNETVVVTGTRTAKLVRESAVRTEVVSRERIEQSASRTLADAVESTPGIRVESNCQNCNFSQVRMLGLEGSYSQILIDGQAQWSPLSMVYGIEQIPTRFIESLEIVKGGGSTIYGAGAVGGVINVLPREPRRTGGTVELRAESMGGSRGHSLNGAYDWVAEDGATWLSLIGQDDSVAAIDRDGDGYTEVSERTLRTLAIRGARTMIGGAADLTLDLGWSDSERRGGNRIDRPPQEADLAEWIATKRRSLSLRWEHRPHAAFDYHVALSYVDTDRDSYYGAERDPDAFGVTDNPLALFEAQLNHRTGAHTVSWGTQVNVDRIVDSQPTIDRTLDERYTNVGIFAQDDWTLGPKAALVYGLRVDRHSELSEPILSPRAALRLTPRSDLTLRTSLATGFRPPSVFDEDLHIELAGGSQRSVVLDPDLEEESSVSFMQGLEWIPRHGEAWWLVEANAFLTELRDVFEEEQIEENLFVKTNAGGAHVYGLELGLGYDLPRLITVEIGWVTQRSRFDSPEADFGSRRFFRTPDRYGVLNVTWRNVRLGEVFLALRYSGSMLVPRYHYDPRDGSPSGQTLVTSPSFLTADVSVSRRFRLGRGRAMRLMVGVRNATDAYQEDVDRGTYRDSAYVYGPRFPRSFYVTTRFDF